MVDSHGRAGEPHLAPNGPEELAKERVELSVIGQSLPYCRHVLSGQILQSYFIHGKLVLPLDLPQPGFDACKLRAGLAYAALDLGLFESEHTSEFLARHFLVEKHSDLFQG